MCAYLLVVGIEAVVRDYWSSRSNVLAKELPVVQIKPFCRRRVLNQISRVPVTQF